MSVQPLWWRRVGLVFVRGVDEDMTTLDTTKNIAYMYICEEISNANYAIIIYVI